MTCTQLDWLSVLIGLSGTTRQPDPGSFDSVPDAAGYSATIARLLIAAAHVVLLSRCNWS